MNVQMNNGKEIHDKLDAAVDLGSTTVKKAVEASQKSYDKTVKQTADNISKASTQALKGVEELNKVQKENNQAFAEVVGIIQKSSEELGKQALASFQEVSELQLNAFKDSLNAKNAQDIVKIQTDVVNKVYNDFVANSNKITKDSNEVINKIANNVNQLFQKYTDKA